MLYVFDNVLVGFVLSFLGEIFFGVVNGWWIVCNVFLLFFLNIGKLIIYKGF